MTDFISRLVTRSFEPATGIKPRLRSIFEPTLPNSGAIFAPDFGLETHDREPTLGEATTKALSVDHTSDRRPIAAQPPMIDLQTMSNTFQPESRDRLAVLGQHLASSIDDAPEIVTPSPVKSSPEQPSDQFEPGSALPPISVTIPQPKVVQSPATKGPAQPNTKPHTLTRAHKKDKIAVVTSGDVAVTKNRPSTQAQVVVQPDVIPARQIEPAAPVLAETARGTTETAPIIHVTIGRLEVRATPSLAPSPRKQRSSPPAMSLDAYLRHRAGEDRR